MADLRNRYGKVVYRIEGDRIYDMYGDWKYTIVGNRINDAYGNWKHEIRGDYLYDTYGNRLGKMKDLADLLGTSGGTGGGDSPDIGEILIGILTLIAFYIAKYTFKAWLFAVKANLGGKIGLILGVFLGLATGFSYNGWHLSNSLSNIGPGLCIVGLIIGPIIGAAIGAIANFITKKTEKPQVGIIVGIALCLGVVILTAIAIFEKNPKPIARSKMPTEIETPRETETYNKNSESTAANETPTATNKTVTESETVTDPRDNKTYNTIKINNQTWIAQNLNYNAQGSKCYGNDESNCQRYGRLYNWAAATKACPSGWHLPSNREWEALYHYVDGTPNTESPYKSATAGRYLKAKNGWNNNEGNSGNGTDDYGFAALPGGLGNSDGKFFSVGNYGNWWSSTEYDGTRAYNRFKSYKHDNAGWESENKSKLFSVRCMMD